MCTPSTPSNPPPINQCSCRRGKEDEGWEEEDEEEGGKPIPLELLRGKHYYRSTASLVPNRSQETGKAVGVGWGGVCCAQSATNTSSCITQEGSILVTFLLPHAFPTIAVVDGVDGAAVLPSWDDTTGQFSRPFLAPANAH